MLPTLRTILAVIVVCLLGSFEALGYGVAALGVALERLGRTLAKAADDWREDALDQLNPARKDRTLEALADPLDAIPGCEMLPRTGAVTKILGLPVVDRPDLTMTRETLLRALEQRFINGEGDPDREPRGILSDLYGCRDCEFWTTDVEKAIDHEAFSIHAMRKIGESEPGPPTHPNCRCVTTPAPGDVVRTYRLPTIKARRPSSTFQLKDVPAAERDEWLEALAADRRARRGNR